MFMFTSLLLASALAPITIAPSTIETHLKVIATKDFEGRMTLRPGMDKTAAYIAGEFKKYGLEAREANSSYIQEYDLAVGYRVGKTNMFTISPGGGKEISLTVGKDFTPLVGSATRLIRSQMVWVGYGEESDFEGVDVKDKVVVAFRGGQTGRGRTNSMKARQAKDAGAIGIVFVGAAAEGSSDLPALTRSQGINESIDIPAVGVSSQFFKDLTGMDFAAARKTEGKQSKPLNGLVKFAAEAESNTGKAKNVIGYLPGTDPNLRNEYIVIGAHFDHLGYGEVGSRSGSDLIHYGADDNGSGTAGLMAAAEYMAKNRTNRRTIIFQAYSAEELGLRGSRAWCDANPNLLSQVSGMINMDMIGTVRFDQTFVFGLSSANWLPLFGNVKVDNLRLLLYPHTRGDSDQASFIAKSVPALFFHTGLTDEYHTEKDTIDRVNFAGAAKVVEAVIQTAMQVDAMPNRLTWNASVERGNKPNDRQQPKGPMESPLKP